MLFLFGLERTTEVWRATEAETVCACVCACVCGVWKFERDWGWELGACVTCDTSHIPVIE